MGFTTVTFWLFLLAVLAIYGFANKKIRWLVLLAASYCFYGLWHREYIFLLAGVTLVSYLAGRRMEMAPSARGRKLWLGAGLVTALGSLFVFKYFDYVLSLLRAYLSPTLNQVSFLELAAPIGISFFTLQVFSYLVDVYRGQQPAEQNLWKYAVFVAFFPQLVAGPITRAKVLLPQIEDLDGLKEENLTIGLFRILWGGVQKYVIADRLSILILEVQASTDPQVSITSLGVLYLYSILLYFDFAGYSNIALGVARLFGVRLAENFRQPYLALDAGDFWNRWHISLSNWLRDYIFYPVMRWLRGFVKKPNSLGVIIIPPLAAMLVSGIWHGTGKNFVFWGLIHGVLLALSAWTARWRKSVQEKAGRVGRILFDAAQWFVTFNAISLAWTFFRMPISEGMRYLSGILPFKHGMPVLDPGSWSTLALLLALFALMEILRARLNDFEHITEMPLLLRWGLTYALLFILLWMGDFASSQPFLYQQF